MRNETQQAESKSEAAGSEMYRLAEELFPLHRSINGEGVRKTLTVLQDHVPLNIVEVPSGTRVFDWEVPQEWNLRDAFIMDSTGQRIVDYADSNLHVVNYSQPVHRRMTWPELKEHLVTLPEHPEWIPYRTAYFREEWGFCLTHQQFRELDRYPDRVYDVRIDASLGDGALSYGELCLDGETDDEVLISTHICHPSLANDNLSGIVVATRLAQYLATHRRRYSYRFIYIPATIGAITWLSENRSTVGKIKHGMVLSGVGDAGGLTYKRSRQGDAEMDRAVSHVLAHSGREHEIRDFTPWGYDERQFCSAGFDLPMGCLMRTPHGEYPEYHTSADNLGLLNAASLGDTFTTCLSIFDVLENNRRFLNRSPFGEPQLGRRGLYRAFGEQLADPQLQQAVLWVLNLSDGHNALLDIAERAGLPFDVVQQAADLLGEQKLLEPPQNAVAHPTCSVQLCLPDPTASVQD